MIRIEEIDDLIELEDEQERAQELMDDIQLEEDLVNEREENRMALTASAKKRGKNTGKRILGRLGLQREDYEDGSEAGRGRRTVH